MFRLFTIIIALSYWWHTLIKGKITKTPTYIVNKKRKEGMELIHHRSRNVSRVQNNGDVAIWEAILGCRTGCGRTLRTLKDSHVIF